MTYAKQLEQETEEARTNLSNTLDELRSRISPGQLIDQLTDGLKDGAPGQFARNLRDQAVKNPMPVAIMGISLAWMMFGSRTNSGQGTMHRVADRVREAAGKVADGVRSAADGPGKAAGKTSEWSTGMADGRDGSQIGTQGRGDGSWVESARQNAGQMAEDAREAVGSLSGSAQRVASDTYEGIAEGGRRTAASISDTTRTAGQRTMQAGSSMIELCREQPLLTTAIGIALGVVLGAMAPSTDVENRVMGKTSGRLKEDIKDVASEQYEKVEHAGEQAFGAVEAKNEEIRSEGEPALQSDRVTLVPDESHATHEPQGRPSDADRAPI